MLTRRGATSLLVLCVLLGAAKAGAQDVRGELQLAFTGSSTLHAFEGTSGPVPVFLTQAGDGHWSAEVNVPVANLDTGNRWRDEKMRSMFAAEQHPQIRGRVGGVDPARVRDTGKLPFQLRIRDVEQPLEASVTQWQQTETRASFVAAFDISLAAFGLEAPQSFFMSVGDAVHVRVRLQLERK